MNVQRRLVPDGDVPNYEEDFLQWCEYQAMLLGARDTTALDWEHLAEEIGDMALSLRHEIESRASTILLHMTKLHLGVLAPPRAGWKETIREQRTQIERLLESAPSLRRHAESRLEKVRRKATKRALASLADYEPANAERYRHAAVDLPNWTLDQILDEDFFPETPDET